MTGRRVRLTKTDSRQLILCELQIAVCPEGKYSPGCGKFCGNNCDGGCRQDTGVCVNCRRGYTGSKCDSLCSVAVSPNCAECTRNSSHCTACLPGYYGETCQSCSTISSNCLDCTPDVGLCTKCTPGYYGSYCQSCSTISSNCLDCTQDGVQCFGCESGYYGYNCQWACSATLDNCVECTQDGSRCTKCTPGYSGTACDYSCATIGVGCLKCGEGICLSCATGYHGYNCSLPCSSISPGCAHCRRYDNVCTACKPEFLPTLCSECTKGRYGSDCSLTSLACQHPQCQTCDRQTGECTACDNNLQPPACTECTKGRYGSDCSLASVPCQRPQCQTCDRQTGECTACDSNLQPPACTECQDGFYGYRSYSQCTPCIGQCYNTPCDKTTGNCAKCPPGRTGNTCSFANINTRHDVTCGETEMSFDIALPADVTIPQKVTLSDPRCAVTGGPHRLQGQTALNACGTTVAFLNDSVVFSNEIFLNPDSNSTANGIVIPIHCHYNISYDLRLSYLPIVRQVLFTEEGVGQFGFQMQQFQDPQYSVAVDAASYPLRTIPSQEIYVQLSLRDLGLRTSVGRLAYGMDVERCLASPLASVTDARLREHEDLILEGCPASGKVHLHRHNTSASGSDYFRFSFHGVTFSSDPADPTRSFAGLVYVHCHVTLCPQGQCRADQQPCSPAGVGQRKKRAATWQSQAAGHQLSTGPLLVLAATEDLATSYNPAVIALSVVAAVACLAVVVVVVAWRRGVRPAKGGFQLVKVDEQE